MRFYRYVTYKLYSWAKKRPNATPIANVVFTMSFVHLMHLFTLFVVLNKLLGWHFLVTIDKNMLYVILPVYFILYYFLFYNKKRWERYIKEFGNESKAERKKGKIYVLSYLIGSILLFFLTLIIAYVL